MLKEIFAPEQYLPGNTLELVASGNHFFERLIQLINEAKQQIHFQVYIFDEDDTGRAIAAALKNAAARGVAIFLAVDSYGSKSLSPAFIADLKRSGVHFKLFSPLPKHFFVFRVGRRLHNKVMIADNAVALVGGINIADKYHGTASEAPWLDFAVGIKGPVCVDLSRICERIYREKYFGKLKSQGRPMPVVHSGTMRSRFVLNDWFRRKNQIGAGYRAAVEQAQQSITIMASYFLPNRSLRNALKKAAQRGVKVLVLLPGESDLPMAKRATRYLYQWLLRNNIGIFEWHESILHGKMAVVDNKWVTIGSYNLNHLSQYSSIEMNIEVLDESFGASAQERLFQLMQQSTPVTTESFKPFHGPLNKFLDWASYTLGRWIMKLLFLAVKRENRFHSDE
jgi:cardiolipin synthase